MIADGTMPPSSLGPLSDMEILMVRKWIQDGALNMDCISNSCDLDSVSFSDDIWPVLNKNCVGCHNSDLANYNINLDSYENILETLSKQRDGIPVILGAIKQMDGFFSMPRDGNKLDACTIAKIELWIENGSPNN